MLLVDVNSQSRDSRARELERLGVTVHCAAGAADCREKLQTCLYNLVLVDLGRDSKGAETLVHDIKLNYPRQLVAFLVGSPLFVATSLTGQQPRRARVHPVRTPTALVSPDDVPQPGAASATPTAAAPAKNFDFGQRIKEAEAEQSA